MAIDTDVLGSFSPTVIIVGCGLGGLACAIACRREGLDVTVVEAAKELSEVGAGIQLPPIALRIMDRFDLIPQLRRAGLQGQVKCRILRWEDGSLIGLRPEEDWSVQKFGYSWHTIHRADYQRVLVEEAKRLGAKIRLNSAAASVDCPDISPKVYLESGEQLQGDVVTGADGLHSNTRTAVLGYVKNAKESGDLAYRINRDYRATYWGPDSHIVMYPVKDGQLLNMVVIRPDDLPAEVARQPGDIAEMRKMFEYWDPCLRRLLDNVKVALKWKIWTMDPLETWTKGSVALLGDACHPTVPYAAAGAAMAVEDGAVIGRLLGLVKDSGVSKEKLPGMLQLYETIRKERTTTTVATADANRDLYHMHDGVEQEKRDAFFGDHDWWDERRTAPYRFADFGFLHELFGFDAVEDAEEGFLMWEKDQQK
ncbi:hypothetical protein M409DRAFT_22372 [Zasmidium cellare ATCC 36951]|uniref:FAD-binding domain-containing protein n=1 Tax=Zasmidium cellare ATCC 36951 TaxID=1080233 RepID=A0A6A6CK05_ZASCE|nr:uncharacterized protein M409DRAFT_22372 [Zasmidium cellare ATCC 36951]KAF2167567.1 hypothetical protein M409DRAFT_22372 [Zasmidium cellare ATCC 36951]